MVIYPPYTLSKKDLSRLLPPHPESWTPTQPTLMGDGGWRYKDPAIWAQCGITLTSWGSGESSGGTLYDSSDSSPASSPFPFPPQVLHPKALLNQISYMLNSVLESDF